MHTFSSHLPSWCNHGDIEAFIVSNQRKVQMELPEYNNIEPYPHINERCRLPFLLLPTAWSCCRRPPKAANWLFLFRSATSSPFSSHLFSNRDSLSLCTDL
ncbi:hypothetical protein PIB30_083903 [Stylosanthes scabra]|uniref:Uncharacterized protein n=1 Tax=Stylosanthes scabra TaxID=79078 RepID=A0ABU6YV70_9FABA|nr:hypothetical protein [Stylosanthes scabra]